MPRGRHKSGKKGGRASQDVVQAVDTEEMQPTASTRPKRSATKGITHQEIDSDVDMQGNEEDYVVSSPSPKRKAVSGARGRPRVKTQSVAPQTADDSLLVSEDEVSEDSEPPEVSDEDFDPSNEQDSQYERRRSSPKKKRGQGTSKNVYPLQIAAGRASPRGRSRGRPPVLSSPSRRRSKGRGRGRGRKSTTDVKDSEDEDEMVEYTPKKQTPHKTGSRTSSRQRASPKKSEEMHLEEAPLPPARRVSSSKKRKVAPQCVSPIRKKAAKSVVGVSSPVLRRSPRTKSRNFNGSRAAAKAANQAIAAVAASDEKPANSEEEDANATAMDGADERKRKRSLEDDAEYAPTPEDGDGIKKSKLQEEVSDEAVEKVQDVTETLGDDSAEKDIEAEQLATDMVNSDKKCRLEEEAEVKAEDSDKLDEKTNAIDDAVDVKVSAGEEGEDNDAEQLEKEEPDIASDYVIVSQSEVPKADSKELQQAVANSNPTDDAKSVEHANAKDEPDPLSLSKAAVGGAGEAPVESAQQNGNEAADPLLQRKYVEFPQRQNGATSNEDWRFTVATYNILADCHAQRQGITWTEPEVLALPARHKRLMEEIKFLNADIICLQEVGPHYFSDELSPALKTLNYDGIFKKRTDESCDEGEATFYKKDVFRLDSSKCVSLRDSIYRELDDSGLSNEEISSAKEYQNEPGVMVISQLHHVKSDRIVTVGNLHVCWGWLKKPNMQCIQICQAVKELLKVAGGTLNPHLLVGDFNSTPDSPMYQLMGEGYLNDESMAKLQEEKGLSVNDARNSLVNVWWRGFQHTSSNVQSAYKLVFGKEPLTSHFSHDRSYKAVDYIWFGGIGYELRAAMQVPAEEIIREKRLPTDIFPSDHISLCAQFQLY